MYARDIKVMPSDVSADGRIKLRSLLDYFQDTAGMAVEDIEGTATELYSRGYAWVVARYEINFTGNMPMLDDTFTLRTYHDPNHGYNTLRMFETDFAAAKTSWLLADVRSGRPVKPLAHIPGITSRDNQEISPDFMEIPPLSAITHTEIFPVRYHDADYNGHANNAAYFEWIYDMSPAEMLARPLKTVCASFRSGARLGETITLEAQSDEERNILLYEVKRQSSPSTKKPSARFLCEWR
ncbi:MAG: hypothetical protein IKQ95_07130 [Synergistaceae bacterium]|nr:hypothetical protein [Synergistaceae bacterium]